MIAPRALCPAGSGPPPNFGWFATLLSLRIPPPSRGRRRDDNPTAPPLALFATIAHTRAHGSIGRAPAALADALRTRLCMGPDIPAAGDDRLVPGPGRSPSRRAAGRFLRPDLQLRGDAGRGAALRRRVAGDGGGQGRPRRPVPAQCAYLHPGLLRRDAGRGHRGQLLAALHRRRARGASRGLGHPADRHARCAGAFAHRHRSAARFAGRAAGGRPPRAYAAAPQGAGAAAVPAERPERGAARGRGGRMGGDAHPRRSRAGRHRPGTRPRAAAIYRRHHRHAQGRDADPPEPVGQRAPDRPGRPAPRRARRDDGRAAVLPRLRQRLRPQPHGGGRRLHRHAAALRCGTMPEGHYPHARHRDARRADDVPGAARSPGAAAHRFLVAARLHLGRRAAARAAQGALRGGDRRQADRRLWPDRDLGRGLGQSL